jgi:hypothetical protein
LHFLIFIQYFWHWADMKEPSDLCLNLKLIYELGKKKKTGRIFVWMFF